MLPEIKMNKKALSEIVGYTILIVIAISLSALVYSFLRLYIPKETATCEEDIKLTLQDYSCSANVLNITITNKGLFKADAVYVRFENSSGFKNQTNPNDFLLYNPDNTPGLNPGKSYNSSYQLTRYNFNTHSGGDYILELQPAIIVDKQIVVCENAIITQPITC